MCRTPISLYNVPRYEAAVAISARVRTSVCTFVPFKEGHVVRLVGLLIRE